MYQYQSGQSYPVAVRVQNTSQRGGIPAAATLKASVKVIGASQTYLDQVQSHDFAAGESYVFSFSLSIPAGIADAGTMYAKLLDSNNNLIDLAQADFVIQTIYDYEITGYFDGSGTHLVFKNNNILTSPLPYRIAVNIQSLVPWLDGSAQNACYLAFPYLAIPDKGVSLNIDLPWLTVKLPGMTSWVPVTEYWANQGLIDPNFNQMSIGAEFYNFYTNGRYDGHTVANPPPQPVVYRR